MWNLGDCIYVYAHSFFGVDFNPFCCNGYDKNIRMECQSYYKFTRVNALPIRHLRVKPNFVIARQMLLGAFPWIKEFTSHKCVYQAYHYTSGFEIQAQADVKIIHLG